MFTTKRFSSILILLLLVSFVLVGCEIPFTSNEDAEATPEFDPNTGGGIQPVAEGATQSEEAPEVESETIEESAPEPVEEVAEEAVIEEEATETEEDESETNETEETEAEEEIVDTVEEVDSSTDVEESDTVDSNTANNTPSNTSPVPPTSGTCPVTHTVQAGENLYRIGLQYGMSWVPIANANGLANANAIYVGQTLVIPVAGCAPVPPQPVPPIEGTTYVVQYGDTLYSIGVKFGVSWVQIAEANGIVNPNQIYAGQVLKIPAAQPGPTPNFTHLVQPGETLFTISIHYGIPWPAIAAANQIPPPYIIYAGQTIIIPGSW